jgi:hypothetical protein
LRPQRPVSPRQRRPPGRRPHRRCGAAAWPTSGKDRHSASQWAGRCRGVAAPPRPCLCAFAAHSPGGPHRHGSSRGSRSQPWRTSPPGQCAAHACSLRSGRAATQRSFSTRRDHPWRNGPPRQSLATHVGLVPAGRRATDSPMWVEGASAGRATAPQLPLTREKHHLERSSSPGECLARVGALARAGLHRRDLSSRERTDLGRSSRPRQSRRLRAASRGGAATPRILLVGGIPGAAASGGSRAASCCGWGGAASGALWLRSGGCARGSRRTRGRPLRACAGGRRRGRSGGR